MAVGRFFYSLVPAPYSLSLRRSQPEAVGVFAAQAAP